MARQVEQRVGLGHGQAHSIFGHLDDLITTADLSLFEHAEVKTWPVVRHQQGRHAGIVHPNSHPVAGHPGLCHLEEGAANPVAIADAYLAVGEPIDGKVLAELSPDEVLSPELLLPIAIGIGLINEDCSLFASVSAQIALTIAVEVKPSYHATARHRTLPYRSVNGLSLPGNVLREAHVNRYQPGDVSHLPFDVV